MKDSQVFEMTAGSGISPETAADLGMKVGTIFGRVGVATDSEPSTVPICAAFISGLSA